VTGDLGHQALALANQKLSLMTKVTRHDITNQLTVMEGYLTLAKDEKDLISISDFLDHASIASRRIAAMIEFTRDYQEIGVKAPIWKNLKTLVETAVKDVPQWKITVVLDIPCNIEVFADPLIVKVFYNLIENAVRYGKGATTLRFALEERTREVILSCEDDGTGIPPEEKDKIFERGYGKGTGLGLFLAREILSITWMTIKETGEYRKGARFEITVPTGVWRQEKVR
jgi:signal transduction histidine kinase